MYEGLGPGGGFQWSSLDPEEKRLARTAIIAGLVPVTLLTVPVAVEGYEFGRWLRAGPGAGGGEAFRDAITSSPWFGAWVLISIVCALVSGIAWWRFGRKQDELYHRMQNHALGRACGAGVAVVLLCWMLSLPGWIDGLPLTEFVYLQAFLFAAFSADAYRRWG